MNRFVLLFFSVLLVRARDTRTLTLAGGESLSGGLLCGRSVRDGGDVDACRTTEGAEEEENTLLCFLYFFFSIVPTVLSAGVPRRRAIQPMLGSRALAERAIDRHPWRGSSSNLLKAEILRREKRTWDSPPFSLEAHRSRRDRPRPLGTHKKATIVLFSRPFG